MNMRVHVPPLRERPCVCVADDAYACWDRRHPECGCDPAADSYEAEIEAAGGPCRCACHDEPDEEDYL